MERSQKNKKYTINCNKGKSIVLWFMRMNNNSLRLRKQLEVN